MQETGYGAYKRVQTATSTPAGLISLLYDGLLTRLRRAQTAIAAADYEVANEQLNVAQAIVLELIASLDHSYGDIPRQLSALYEYMYQRLVRANIDKDVEPIREVEGHVMQIAEAWAVAARQAEAESRATEMGRVINA
ncbi:MAG: flagellar export chaperone FliS [Dehalococcoidia bacterium]